MDGIIQLMIGLLALWISFGVLKHMARAAFFIVTIIAALILCWGAFDMVYGVIEDAAFMVSHLL